MSSNYEKLVKNIREKGIKVFLAPKENLKSGELTQTAVRFMIERNLKRLETETRDAKNFAEVLKQAGEVIDHAD